MRQIVKTKAEADSEGAGAGKAMPSLSLVLFSGEGGDKRCMMPFSWPTTPSISSDNALIFHMQPELMHAVVSSFVFALSLSPKPTLLYDWLAELNPLFYGAAPPTAGAKLAPIAIHSAILLSTGLGLSKIIVERRAQLVVMSRFHRCHFYLLSSKIFCL
ncbi:uncharacterized protein SPSK_10592 [Sporothrix schenckii 1099-18]|uniref:Uncharacterized protein n=1 Tax=Sporothrix schenckii 1099-18 TaxID=1397361 RepID=A0A0F2M2E4_SPOSC|nr:uncharacterized protein SPSK_10592 [Sporothrix schenckii 1099-18]KJR82925.1 hypothetical protein SPSK_10592 [Sporothrix schenckii 1099-18]